MPFLVFGCHFVVSAFSFESGASLRVEKPRSAVSRDYQNSPMTLSPVPNFSEIPTLAECHASNQYMLSILSFICKLGPKILPYQAVCTAPTTGWSDTGSVLPESLKIRAWKQTLSHAPFASSTLHAKILCQQRKGLQCSVSQDSKQVSTAPGHLYYWVDSGRYCFST